MSSSGVNNKMKVGVLGGTFDPIHIGHLTIAKEVKSSLGLGEVIFITAREPYFKSHKSVTRVDHRIAMVELALCDDPHFRSSDIEANRPGPTYTVDTLIELHRRYSCKVEIYLILGMDVAREINDWKSPRNISELCTVVAVRRPGIEIPDHLKGAVASNGSLISISGSDIRQRVYQGKSIKHMVPASVEEYIQENRLYNSKYKEIEGVNEKIRS